MKLSSIQLEQINRYLDKMELVHLDLRNEVVDHMATSIEKSMLKGISFDDAFEETSKNWHPELKSHQSFWLGLLWIGPKLLIDKVVAKTKEMYMHAALITLVFLALFFVLKNDISLSVLNIIDPIIGIVYLVLFVILMFLSYKIKATRYKTSFSFLFKIHAIGFSFILVLYNPIITNFFSVNKDNSLNLVAVAVHVFAMAFCYSFLGFYKNHKSNNDFILS